MLHRVAAGTIVPPRRSGGLTQPLQKVLAADPADRPTMAQVRDELATLAAGGKGDTTTILMARTDLGSATPGRTRTTSFPAGAAAAATPAAPAAPVQPLADRAAPPPAYPPAAAPPPPPRDRPSPEYRPAEPGRRRGLWVAAAAVVLVLAGLIALWAANPFADNTSNAQGSSAASTSATSQSSEPSQPSATSAAPTSAQPPPAAPPADAGSGRGQDVDKAVQNFFKGVPKDLPAAYALTSPSFQSQHSYENFSGFWNTFQDVKVSNIRTQDGSLDATIDIEYIWSPQRKQTERHLFTFVVGDGGKLLLDNDAGQGVIG
jgi:hypothetical protein